MLQGALNRKYRDKPVLGFVHGLVAPGIAVNGPAGPGVDCNLNAVFVQLSTNRLSRG